MKKTIMVFLFLLITTALLAPISGTLFIERSESINPYQRLIYAIGMVECAHDTTAINTVEDAWGYFQIRPIRLNDYYKQTGIRYSLEEMLEYKKAERVFLFYARQRGPYALETIAKRWNGSGPKTVEYWRKVKAYL